MVPNDLVHDGKLSYIMCICYTFLKLLKNAKIGKMKKVLILVKMLRKSVALLRFFLKIKPENAHQYEVLRLATLLGHFLYKYYF